MTLVAFFDLALPAGLPGRTAEPAVADRRGAVRCGDVTLYESDPFAHSICVQPHEDERKSFARERGRLRHRRGKATLELCDRLSDAPIEADAVVHRARPDVVCDSGYGIAPYTAIEEGVPPIPDYHVLRPGEPTTNTVWTAVGDCTRFEAFSEEGCATGAACTPALHIQSGRKTKGAEDDRDVHSF